ncbi:hypothetical protein BH11PSE10_BH11PSE10_19560 [soil metagenome]
MPEAGAGGANAAAPLRQAAVPQGRVSRFLHLGRAVGELALSSASLGVSRWARGDRPDLSQLLLTPSNARRLAGRLSAMRGAQPPLASATAAWLGAAGRFGRVSVGGGLKLPSIRRQSKRPVYAGS